VCPRLTLARVSGMFPPPGKSFFLVFFFPFERFLRDQRLLVFPPRPLSSAAMDSDTTSFATLGVGTVHVVKRRTLRLCNESSRTLILPPFFFFILQGRFCTRPFYYPSLPPYLDSEFPSSFSLMPFVLKMRRYCSGDDFSPLFDGDVLALWSPRSSPLICPVSQ